MNGHVRRRGQKWAFVVEMSSDASTGRRRQKWVSGFATKALAQKALREKLRLLDDSTDAFPAEPTVRSFAVDQWLPHLEKQGKIRARTIDGYRQHRRDHVLPHIGAMELRTIRVAHVQRRPSRMDPDPAVVIRSPQGEHYFYPGYGRVTLPRSITRPLTVRE